MAVVAAHLAAGLANALECTFGGAPSPLGIAASALGPVLWFVGGWSAGRVGAVSFVWVLICGWIIVALSGWWLLSSYWNGPHWLGNLLGGLILCPLHGLTGLNGGDTSALDLVATSVLVITVSGAAWLGGALRSRYLST